ncbi:hypothetical protein [Parvicella tangerina]|nr:hypothetical protein [Parvicella tangerina]
MYKQFTNQFFVFSTIIASSQTTYEVAGFNSIYNKSFHNLFSTFSDKPNYIPQSIGIISNRLPMASGGSFEFGFYGSIIFSQMIPQKVNLYDTLNMTLSGFKFRISRELYYWDPIDHFTVLTSVSGSTGRLKLWGDKRANQKNQFYRLELGFQPRLILGKFALSIHAFYGLDIGSGKWKKTWFNKTPQIELPRFTQGGLDLGVSLGYAFK